MALRYAYNTNGFFRHRLDDALTMIAEAGYGGVALTPDVCHLDPYADDVAAETRRVGRRLRALGLTCGIETGAYFVIDGRRKHAPTLISAEAEDRARRMDFLDRCMAIASELEAENFTFWAGVLEPGVERERAWNWLVEGTERVVGRARSLGLVPAFEPEPEMMVRDVADYRRLQETVPELKLALDLGHCTVTQDILPEHAILAFRDHLATVHLEDMRNGVHLHLPFGEGDMNLDAVLAALREIDFKNLVCVELSADAHRAPQMVRTAKTWLDARTARKAA